jgi:hypothetical protein
MTASVNVGLQWATVVEGVDDDDGGPAIQKKGSREHHFQ